MLCNVGVRPALMVRPASASAQVLAFAENTAQPHSVAAWYAVGVDQISSS